jgi:hypothetical protein
MVAWLYLLQSASAREVTGDALLLYITRPHQSIPRAVLANIAANAKIQKVVLSVSTVLQVARLGGGAASKKVRRTDEGMGDGSAALRSETIAFGDVAHAPPQRLDKIRNRAAPAPGAAGAAPSRLTRIFQQQMAAASADAATEAGARRAAAQVRTSWGPHTVHRCLRSLHSSR